MVKAPEPETAGWARFFLPPAAAPSACALRRLWMQYENTLLPSAVLMEIYSLCIARKSGPLVSGDYGSDVKQCDLIGDANRISMVCAKSRFSG